MDQESNNVCRRRRRLAHEEEEEDMLSALPDDILLSILGRAGLATAARTSAPSTRWRNLPWLLPKLNLHARHFLPAPCPDYPERIKNLNSEILLHQAMASLTRAATSFLRTKQSGSTAATMSLEIYLVGNYSHDIGPLVRDAIDNGMVKELDLSISDDKIPKHCKDADMVQKARNVDGFLRAYPNMLPCITRLQLYNLRFAEGVYGMHHILFDCCKQLQHLSLENYDAGDCSLWQINVPDSSLRVLEIYSSCFKRIEVLCLPKLERLHWEVWMHTEARLRFGSVPSLKELFLVCDADLDVPEFSLCQLLNGATGIHTLTLNFQGEKLWIQQERKQLFRAAFNKLKKLCIYGVYVEFDGQ
ncbi:uncharacterized protein LOC100844327 isoform X1 [Brachypodium distachyon]|uniref:F-box/LRR-repeat protein 15/At3g58940/PEG3-like LRR domain-containing protein n=2 Tax=Brachypodium distachyon TaxID=15368 RepID=A0A0Q3JHW5_BRADI|nr:uncharacterized protein LOC100844327 isoform X1 [Brachypodium distachyon]KQK17331.1 hypothetical protein BRADI_1g33760v3 [Brachypodium distachyon]|eukprot:XP_024313150.1 uncharacterized protein LOC100844327 isoform X1 [Brachypodium distachyon]